MFELSPGGFIWKETHPNAVSPRLLRPRLDVIAISFCIFIRPTQISVWDQVGKRRWTILYPTTEAGAKLSGRMEIVSANTAQGDDGRHGLRPQVIGILGTGQRSSLTPLRPFIGHHPKKKNDNFFLPVLFVQKTCSLLFKPMYVLYCVFAVSTSLRRFTSASKASSFRLYPPHFSGSSYRSVFVLLLTNFIRCDHFFL